MSLLLLSGEGAMASSNTDKCGHVKVNASGVQTKSGALPKSSSVYNMPVSFDTTVYYDDRSHHEGHHGKSYYRLTYCVNNITYHITTPPSPSNSCNQTLCNKEYANCMCGGSNYVCGPRMNQYWCSSAPTSSNQCNYAKATSLCTKGQPVSASNTVAIKKKMMAKRKKSATQGGVLQAGNVCITLPKNLESHHKGQCSKSSSAKHNYGFDFC